MKEKDVATNGFRGRHIGTGRHRQNESTLISEHPLDVSADK